jgi:hypothetical protein
MALAMVQGTVCKILNEQEVKPHKVRYYLERRVAGVRRTADDQRAASEVELLPDAFCRVLHGRDAPAGRRIVRRVFAANSSRRWAAITA